jgi:hypothetical protein
MGDPSGQQSEHWPIVGRDGELAALRQAIDAASVGRGSIVVVEGAPGSGRTRLVREAAAQARQLDFRVVWLPEHTDVASSVTAAALDDAARGRPVVIVDDEEPSASFPSIGIDLSRMPVLVLLTRTAVDDHAGEAAPGWHVRRVRVPPLRPGVVMALAARMGTGASTPTLERLHAATGGNALLVVETLGALGRAEDLAEPEPWPLSERALAWLRVRLDAMSPAGRDALEAASILGEECEVGLVAQVLGESADTSHVGMAIGASGFVVLPNAGRRCRFVPPLARDLVYASLSAERRATLHTRAAVAFAASGTTPRAVLAHRGLAASASGDARRCAHYVGRLVNEPTALDAAANPSSLPYFVREGEHWAIGFGDRAIRLHDRTGLHYLARLLSRPGVEFAALALGKRPGGTNGDESSPDEPPLATERARVRVTRRIRDGIERIARVHPALGAHFERTIRTGAHCVYMVDPVSAPRWEIRWSV